MKHIIDETTEDFDAAVRRALIDTGDMLEELQGPILVMAHTRPDGDAVGSLEAMSHLLMRMGHDVVAYMPDVPAYLAFAAKLATADLNDAQLAHFPTIVTVDAASKGRRTPIPDEAYAGHVVVNVDHHGSNSFDADHQLVIATASSACEIIHQIEAVYGVSWDDQAAEIAFCEAVYLGLCTDTGNFAYALTSPLTHEVAADCMRRGADTVGVRQQLSRRQLAETQLLGEALSHAQYMHADDSGNPRLARVVMPQPFEVEAPNMQPVLSMLRSIEHISVSMACTPQDDGAWRVSLRSGGLDVASIAERHGGGGHRPAAGCKAHSSEEIEQITSEVMLAIDEAAQA
jgi:phosphoesterase RecJ-like protein